MIGEKNGDRLSFFDLIDLQTTIYGEGFLVSPSLTDGIYMHFGVIDMACKKHRVSRLYHTCHSHVCERPDE